MSEEQTLTRKDRERIFRRNEIIAAAIPLFAQKGFHSTTLDDIALNSEFGKGTIYNYFTNKEEIYSKILENVIADNLKLLQECDSAFKSFEDFIKNYTTSIIRYCVENKHAFQLWVREVAHLSIEKVDFQWENLTVSMKQMSEILMKRFQQAINKNEVIKVEPLHLVSLYQHIVYPFINHLLICRNEEAIDSEKESNFLLTVLLNGILK